MRIETEILFCVILMNFNGVTDTSKWLGENAWRKLYFSHILSMENWISQNDPPSEQTNLAITSYVAPRINPVAGALLFDPLRWKLIFQIEDGEEFFSLTTRVRRVSEIQFTKSDSFATRRTSRDGVRRPVWMLKRWSTDPQTGPPGARCFCTRCAPMRRNAHDSLLRFRLWNDWKSV